MPIEDIGRRRDDLWELVRLHELFVLEEVSHELGALVPLIEISVGQLGWPDGGADKLADLSFIPGGQHELPRGVINDLELSLVLQDVF